MKKIVIKKDGKFEAAKSGDLIEGAFLDFFNEMDTDILDAAIEDDKVYMSVDCLLKIGLDLRTRLIKLAKKNASLAVLEEVSTCYLALIAALGDGFRIIYKKAEGKEDGECPTTVDDIISEILK